MQTSKRFAIRNFSLRNLVICWQSQEKGVGRATISTTKKRSKHANGQHMQNPRFATKNHRSLPRLSCHESIEDCILSADLLQDKKIFISSDHPTNSCISK